MTRKLYFFDPPPAILASRIRARIQELCEENEAGIEYNTEIGEYIAVALTGAEVYGASRQECYDNLREANRVWLEHCKKCQEE